MSELKRSLAVVIGINQYDVNNGVPALETAVHDAKELAFILEDKYKYQVLPLLDTDATQSRLDSLLAAFTQKMLLLPDGSKVQIEPDDRVLFYFAGHGIALDGLDNTEGPAGYLVPQDAKLDDSSTLLPMQQLHDALVQLPCRHLLIILDCCFAGTFRWAGLHRDAVRSQRMYRERYERFTSGYAQQVITSAAYDEKALDSVYRFGQRGKIEGHSPFADLLLKALNGVADLTKDGVLTATELYVYLHSELGKLTSKQTPGLCQLKRHDKGEYIFVSPDFAEEKLQKAPLLDEKSNPYRGLESFDEAHQELFFGRQRVINELYAHLSKREKPPLTVVLGASGTGKSSLVKAGLLPRLREKQWQIIEPSRPGKSPFAALAKAVLHATNASARDDLNCINMLSEKLQQAPQTFTEMVSLGNNSEQKLILVIDQFEELITMCQPEEQQQFLSWLKALLANHSRRLNVVITLRSDFEPQFSSVLLERSDWMAARFVVPLMTQDDLREVIEKPAAEKAMYFEPPKLVERLINDVVQMPGALPLLSFTLRELYLKYLQRRGNNRAMTQEDYEDLGGVMGSLTKRATEEYEKLAKFDPANEQSVRRVMLRMVSVEGGESARRRVPKSELVYRHAKENQRVQQVIQAFSEARLIVEGTNSQGEPYIEPAHDALVRGWDKLQQWRTQEQANLLLQRELTSDANKWATNKKQAVGILWDDDPRLPLVEQVSDLDNGWLNFLELEFVEHSRLKRRKNRVGLSIAATGVIVFLMGFAFIQYIQNLDAQIRASSASAQAFSSSGQEFEALLESLKAAKTLKQLKWLRGASTDTQIQTIISLQKAVNGVRERNRLEGHTYSVNGASFSQDGKTIASASDDSTVKLWNLDGTLRKNLQQPGSRFNSVSFSPQGKVVASADWDKTVKLWSIDGTLLKTLKGHRYGVNSVSFSPDGKAIASASWDKTIKFWSLDGKELKTLKGHSDEVISVSFSSDGKTIASASQDKTVKLWNLDGKELKTLKGHSDGVNSVSFSSDGKTLTSASTDNTVKIWSLNGRKPTMFQDSSVQITTVSFSPDGQTIALVRDDGLVKLRHLQGRLLRPLEEYDDIIISVGFSPDGKTIASAENSIELSSDGRTIPSTKVKLRSINGTLLKTFKGHTNLVASVTFSPDGKLLASASNDKTVKLWNLDGKELATFRGHTNNVNSASFSSDSKLIASASKDNTIKVWLLNGKELKTFKGHTDRINSVSFSPDGKLLASASNDSTVRLWRFSSREPIILRGHSGWVKDVTFSPDGKVIASAGADNTVKLWSLNGRELKTLQGHSSTVLGVKFTFDGKTLISVSGDGTVIMWNLDLGDLQVQGCNWVHDYLKNNSNVSKSDRHLCNGIYTIN
ncbi:WD40 repeat-containing protein [Crinalium epipsammum PCC 9333]|uniref:WD40 repeat-containing protein n=1 Tax=Crinalium epipsammum PCC 9333 TaxID=1173022 RepID=K9VUM6_9CYAN|nr:caspase family protein [Crinalium epipsammum]AFZ11646.1 WD40 repeat-containing protein [Crinalium epipsammum PCC 9333]